MCVCMSYIGDLLLMQLKVIRNPFPPLSTEAVCVYLCAADMHI